jgi:integrase
MTHAAPALRALPVIVPGRDGRTTRDRLELLTALMDAPAFDPLFRPDVIKVPGDHPVYGWICGVPECQRGREATADFCFNHDVEWRNLKREGQGLDAFLKNARPLPTVSWHDPPDCLICPGIPAASSIGLCKLHVDRWYQHRLRQQRRGQPAELDVWLASESAFVPFGQCQVDVCPEQAVSPLGLCSRHRYRYKSEGRPGGADLPKNWGRWLADLGKTVPVAYTDEAAFRRWCTETGPIVRMNGCLSLLRLRPLVKREIQWSMFQHTQMPVEGNPWPFQWLQHVAEDCRRQGAASLADLDLGRCRQVSRKIVKTMLRYLRLIYFTRQDTKDAGFIDLGHFGVRIEECDGLFDLSGISQRWLRDLLWESLADRLVKAPPRSRNPLETRRRGCMELSAYLEAQAPEGGHDPTLLTADHMIDFLTDQRHRAEHGLPSLAFPTQRGGRKPTRMTKMSVGQLLNGLRQLLREALESGEAERAGLHRAFIVALPTSGIKGGRRRPFPDDVARALAHPDNLARLAAGDPGDRGLRDIWETLVFTGRRCGEVLNARLNCISRHNGVPLFWHDQTKVGNLDAAIRIPERLYQTIERRQDTTIARFVQRQGREPSAEERSQIALFPRRTSNRECLKGVSYGWFHRLFRTWVISLDIGHCVPHQTRHTLATQLLRNGADLTHVKRYLGQVSERMAEHYVHLAHTDPRLNDALNAIWVAGPGTPEPGILLTTGEPMTREEAEAMLVDLTRKSTPAEGGFCTFQPVVDGAACPWKLNCHNCDKFVMTGADLVYWHRKREQWRMLAERAPDSATADYLHEAFEPTARAIAGLERALEAVGLLDEALALDLRRPQDYFGRVWSTAFRAQELAREDNGAAA